MPEPFEIDVPTVVSNHSCRVCGREDRAKPMAFRGEQWCSDRHRKVITAELPPTQAELNSMDPSLFQELSDRGSV